MTYPAALTSTPDIVEIPAVKALVEGTRRSSDTDGHPLFREKKTMAPPPLSDWDRTLITWLR